MDRLDESSLNCFIGCLIFFAWLLGFCTGLAVRPTRSAHTRTDRSDQPTHRLRFRTDRSAGADASAHASADADAQPPGNPADVNDQPTSISRPDGT